MRPNFLLNSFTKQLYAEEEESTSIIPLIETNINTPCQFGFDPMQKFEIKNKYDEGGNYWTLRHVSSNKRIQKLKDIKLLQEMNSIRDKPHINGKSKQMIDKEYKEINVLRRMELFNNRTSNKAKKQLKDQENQIKQNMQQMKKSSNGKFNSVQSRYMNSFLNDNNNINKKNTADYIIKGLSNDNNTISKSNEAEYTDDNNRTNQIEAEYTDENNDKSNETERKRDLNKFISFMNRLSPK